jgi:hypothetical protein
METVSVYDPNVAQQVALLAEISELPPPEPLPILEGEQPPALDTLPSLDAAAPLPLVVGGGAAGGAVLPPLSPGATVSPLGIEGALDDDPFDAMIDAVVAASTPSGIAKVRRKPEEQKYAGLSFSAQQAMEVAAAFATARGCEEPYTCELHGVVVDFKLLPEAKAISRKRRGVTTLRVDGHAVAVTDSVPKLKKFLKLHCTA